MAEKEKKPAPEAVEIEGSGKFDREPPPGMLPDGKLNVVGFEPIEGGARVHIHRVK